MKKIVIIIIVLAAISYRTKAEEKMKAPDFLEQYLHLSKLLESPRDSASKLERLRDLDPVRFEFLCKFWWHGAKMATFRYRESLDIEYLAKSTDIKDKQALQLEITKEE